MMRMSVRSCVTHSSLGRSTCFILPESGSLTVVVRFHTKRPMYFSSLRIRDSVETSQPPFSLAFVGTFSSFSSLAIFVIALPAWDMIRNFKLAPVVSLSPVPDAAASNPTGLKSIESAENMGAPKSGCVSPVVVSSVTLM